MAWWDAVKNITTAVDKFSHKLSKYQLPAFSLDVESQLLAMFHCDMVPLIGTKQNVSLMWVASASMSMKSLRLSIDSVYQRMGAMACLIRITKLRPH